MYDSNRPHPLLAQVPLTVSPFIQLPTAVTLPYTYKTVPTALPPSITSEPKYVTSRGGHAAAPADIIASCRALQQHIRIEEENAKKAIKDWEDGIKERELAEKRRVAPGWLDRDEKILEPTKVGKPVGDLLDEELGVREEVMAPAMQPSKEGEELDRAFGGMGVK